uniref:Peptidase M12A domain-containing protein n=1 Tax=Meloidogyne hapla TaxID=6305 RepID=A0A1I8B6G2_MELHA
MHYAKDAFASAPGKITMETLERQYQAFKINIPEIIGKVKDAAPSDYLKICNIYSCHSCMGRPFTPGQNRPEIGQRVLTLGPWPVTLPTGSPSPATLPLRPTTTTITTTTIRTTTSRPRTTRRTTTWAPPPTCPPPPPPPPISIENEKEEENVIGERRWPTPQLPIILPLINNNWWWKNTPAPPFRYPPLLRRQMDVELENKSKEEETDELEDDDEDDEKMEENRREEEKGRKNEENWHGGWEKQWKDKIEEREEFREEEKEDFEEEENNEEIWGSKEEFLQCLEESTKFYATFKFRTPFLSSALRAKTKLGLLFFLLIPNLFVESKCDSGDIALLELTEEVKYRKIHLARPNTPLPLNKILYSSGYGYDPERKILTDIDELKTVKVNVLNKCPTDLVREDDAICADEVVLDQNVCEAS